METQTEPIETLESLALTCSTSGTFGAKIVLPHNAGELRFPRVTNSGNFRQVTVDMITGSISYTVPRTLRQVENWMRLPVGTTIMLVDEYGATIDMGFVGHHKYTKAGYLRKGC